MLLKTYSWLLKSYSLQLAFFPLQNCSLLVVTLHVSFGSLLVIVVIYSLFLETYSLFLKICSLLVTTYSSFAVTYSIFPWVTCCKSLTCPICAQTVHFCKFTDKRHTWGGGGGGEREREREEGGELDPHSIDYSRKPSAKWSSLKIYDMFETEF